MSDTFSKIYRVITKNAGNTVNVNYFNLPSTKKKQKKKRQTKKV